MKANMKMTIQSLLLLLVSAVSAPAAQGGAPLFFREDWAETPAETPVTQAHVANHELALSVHGPGGVGVKKSHHDKPADDPYYIWSGTAPANWAISLRRRNADVDLRGPAQIRWRTKQSGFRQLRVVLQLADGTWLVSDASDGPSPDWRERRFKVSELRWRRLNITTIVEGDWIKAPDLSRVREVGCTDLMRGGNTPASSRLDWIEVYGRTVSRPI